VDLNSLRELAVGPWVSPRIGEEDAGRDDTFVDRRGAGRDFALRLGGVARTVAVDEQAAEGFGAPELGKYLTANRIPLRKAQGYAGWSIVILRCESEK
jgi:hypothetical protein